MVGATHVIHRVRVVGFAATMESADKVRSVLREQLSAQVEQLVGKSLRPFDHIAGTKHVRQLQVCVQVKELSWPELSQAIEQEVGAECQRVAAMLSRGLSNESTELDIGNAEDEASCDAEWLLEGLVSGVTPSSWRHLRHSVTKTLQTQTAEYIERLGQRLRSARVGLGNELAAWLRFWKLVDLPGAKVWLEQVAGDRMSGQYPQGLQLMEALGQAQSSEVLMLAAVQSLLLENPAVDARSVRSECMRLGMPSVLMNAIPQKQSSAPQSISESADPKQVLYSSPQAPPANGMSGDGRPPLERMDDPHSRSTDSQELLVTNGYSTRLVDDAGLILLHPWVPLLLRRVGIEDQALMNQEPFAVSRAALVLYTIVFGPQAKVQDFDHGITRLLLGSTNVSLETLLPTVAIQQQELLEIDQMMRSAIQHWGALGSTDPDGLRREFLQRRGVLIESPQEYRLHVESRGVDVLLRRLTWSYSCIRLRWMTKPLFVEWGEP